MSLQKSLWQEVTDYHATIVTNIAWKSDQIGLLHAIKLRHQTLVAAIKDIVIQNKISTSQHKIDETFTKFHDEIWHKKTKNLKIPKSFVTPRTNQMATQNYALWSKKYKADIKTKHDTINCYKNLFQIPKITTKPIQTIYNEMLAELDNATKNIEKDMPDNIIDLPSQRTGFVKGFVDAIKSSKSLIMMITMSMAFFLTSNSGGFALGFIDGNLMGSLIASAALVVFVIACTTFVYENEQIKQSEVQNVNTLLDNYVKEHCKQLYTTIEKNLIDKLKSLEKQEVDSLTRENKIYEHHQNMMQNSQKDKIRALKQSSAKIELEEKERQKKLDSNDSNNPGLELEKEKKDLMDKIDSIRKTIDKNNAIVPEEQKYLDKIIVSLSTNIQNKSNTNELKPTQKNLEAFSAQLKAIPKDKIQRARSFLANKQSSGFHQNKEVIQYFEGMVVPEERTKIRNAMQRDLRLIQYKVSDKIQPLIINLFSKIESKIDSEDHLNTLQTWINGWNFDDFFNKPPLRPTVVEQLEFVRTNYHDKLLTLFGLSAPHLSLPFDQLKKLESERESARKKQKDLLIQYQNIKSDLPITSRVFVDGIFKSILNEIEKAKDAPDLQWLFADNLKINTYSDLESFLSHLKKPLQIDGKTNEVVIQEIRQAIRKNILNKITKIKRNYRAAERRGSICLAKTFDNVLQKLTSKIDKEEDLKTLETWEEQFPNFDSSDTPIKAKVKDWLDALNKQFFNLQDIELNNLPKELEAEANRKTLEAETNQKAVNTARKRLLSDLSIFSKSKNSKGKTKQIHLATEYLQKHDDIELIEWAKGPTKETWTTIMENAKKLSENRVNQNEIVLSAVNDTFGLVESI